VETGLTKNVRSSEKSQASHRRRRINVRAEKLVGMAL
jgi:hypothetical protein